MTSSSPETFGALLRHRRIAAGLTQEALAERAGLSARGIQLLERGGRTSPRAETVRLLADALGLSAEAHAELIGAAHPELTTARATASAGPSPSRLPAPPTPLVGREREVAAASALLPQPDVRLVTLTGPGGIGKTRLALAVAAEVAPSFADGVVWIDLAPLRDPALVANAVARALGVHESGDRPLAAVLADAVAARHLLLVVDNCEHVLEAMSRFGELLAAGPRLSLLATSRARLRLRGERELPVAPLALPPGEASGAAPLAGLAGVASVRLFVARAAEIRPGFALTADNADAIAAICRRLEGLPLALELAAAWVRVLPPALLLTRLAQRLPLLASGARDHPPRQQTMRDAIAWSHDLLSESEQALFRRLAVFAGGCTLDAAEAVASRGVEESRSREKRPLPYHPITPPPSSDTLDGLAALVEQSLLRWAEPSVPGVGEARFAMLETVREYAMEDLAASDEADSLRRAHADFFLALAERAEPELIGPAQTVWLDRLEGEHDNLRAALTWALDSEAALALRLAAALGRFWRMRGHPQEGLSWLEQALALHGEEVSAARGKALEEAGWLVHDRGDPEQTEALQMAALAIWRAIGDRRGEARSLDELGNIAHDRGDFARAAALHEEALALARAAGDRRVTARCLNNLAMVDLYQSQDERAWRRYSETLALLREVGDAYGVNVVLTNLGIVAIQQVLQDMGDERAAARFGTSPTLAQRGDDTMRVADGLDEVAGVAIRKVRVSAQGSTRPPSRNGDDAERWLQTTRQRVATRQGAAAPRSIR